MKKIKNFKIKNCVYWQEQEGIYYKEFCALHRDKEDQPPEIIKELQKEQKEQSKIKSVFLIMLFIEVICLMSLIYSLTKYSQLPESHKLLVISNTVSFSIYLFNTIYFFRSFTKNTKETIKELNQQKNEWIIEYE